MMNFFIICFIIYAVLGDTNKSDYNFSLKELPWWFFVLSGFTISLLGLFAFNDDKIIFMGCGLLLVSKIIKYYELKHWRQ